MTVRIMFDMYSGRPNPTITLIGGNSRTFLRAVALNRSMVAALSANPGRLGYRGTVVSILAPELAQEFGLPPVFILAGGGSQNEQRGTELVISLLEGNFSPRDARPLGGETPEVHRYILEQVRNVLLGERRSVTLEPEAPTARG
jgi:hypothetical protein